jgi:hypothetical protein
MNGIGIGIVNVYVNVGGRGRGRGRGGPWAARRGAALFFWLLVGLAAGGCARAAAPGAGAAQPPFPDMAGRTVMLLPVQRAVPTITLPPTADAAVPPALLSAELLLALEGELAFWLQERAPRARWILPDAVERAAQQSPMMDVRARDLSVRDFQRARLQSIGDPLYGELRRLGAVLDARVALLPVGALWVTEQTGAGRVHLVVALIDTVGGDVVWYGVVAGTAGARGDAAVIASAAQALAELIPR